MLEATAGFAVRFIFYALGPPHLSTSVGYHDIMRIPKSIWLCGISVILVSLLLYLHVGRQYQQREKEFETTLEQNVDPEELRQWAINFMNEHSEASGEAATNAPASLHQVSQDWPHVIFDKSESEPHLVLCWLRTDLIVEIGRTNFFIPADSRVKMWKKGIYLIKPNKQ